MFLATLHASPRADRSCASISSWDLSSNFHSVGTAKMRNFDLYFTEWWSFVFSDVCVTLVAFVNRTRRNGPKILVPFRKTDKDSGGSVSWNAQHNCRTSSQCGNEHLLPDFQPDFDKKSLHGCRLVFLDGLLPLRLLLLDALLPLGVGGSEDGVVFWCRCCTFITVVPETAFVSSRTLPLLLSTDSKLLFLFQYHLIPCDS